MGEEKKAAPRPQYLEDAVVVFADTAELLHRTIDGGVKKEDEQYFIVIASTLNIAVAIRKLLYREVNTENEAFMLMRPLLERLVNYHYLRLTSEEERERFFSFPYYRIYHNRTQEFQVDGIKIELHEEIPEPDKVKEIPEFKRALELFSETDRRMSWSTKNFPQRVEVVVRGGKVNTGILALVSLLNYKDTSEVIHGSMYGMMVLTGIWDSGSYEGGVVTADEAAKRISKKLTLQLSLLARLMIDTARVLDNGNVDNFKAELDELISRVLAILETLDKDTV
ncbi:MAG: DUF5677 domain-containing protein [Candidatus Saccharimonas sp.]